MGFKNQKFYADLKMGLFIVVSSPYQKLEPKYYLQQLKSLKIEFFGPNF
jgi:hypothetical protein